MDRYAVLLVASILLVVAGCTTGIDSAGTAVSSDAAVSADAFDSKFEMSFFITSTGPGKGADFGGLEGADAYCTALASSAGTSDRIWRAYLSTTGEGGIDARDRIGDGPWYNSKGALIANNLDELHSSNNLTKETALTERGEIVNGRGDTPNRHDILTGSSLDGTLYESMNSSMTDTTCDDWTSSADGVGSARVGHHDRQGGGSDPTSWNSAHDSRGCSQENLKSTGGDGLIYCFAAD